MGIFAGCNGPGGWPLEDSAPEEKDENEEENEENNK